MKINIKNLILTIDIEEKECINNETMENEVMTTFSMSGYKKGYGSGQIFDAVEKRIKEGTFTPRLTKAEKETLLNLIGLWREYHLNYLTAGTINQTNYLNKLKHEENLSLAVANLENIREELRDVDLLEDKTFNYGSGWLCKPIPKYAIYQINECIRVLS